MSINETFLRELTEEAAITRKMLQRVPVADFIFQPHEKSFALGQLAPHIAEIYGWTELIISSPELDFATMKYTPPVVETNEDLLKLFDENLEKAKKHLSNADETKYNDPWTMRQGEQIFFTMSKQDVIRKWVLNHVIHHRAQLGLYLRLLDIPIPGTYGPSADDKG